MSLAHFHAGKTGILIAPLDPFRKLHQQQTKYNSLQSQNLTFLTSHQHQKDSSSGDLARLYNCMLIDE